MNILKAFDNTDKLLSRNFVPIYTHANLYETNLLVKTL